MNIYARIRSIENNITFKGLIDTLLAAEFPHHYQATKDLCDFGIDGRLKKRGIVYAVYCPRYPERKEEDQYRRKIKGDIKKLVKAITNKHIKFQVKTWCFVTPDDLPVSILELVDSLTKQQKWDSHTYTAQTLAPLFMKHKSIHADFPEITAGLQYDKIPSVYIRFANNRNYPCLEVFNNGTEDIQDFEIKIGRNKESLVEKNDSFLYDFDDPRIGYLHSCFSLKKGERQYLSATPIQGDFYYNISGLGVESRKTFNQEGYIPPTSS